MNTLGQVLKAIESMEKLKAEKPEFYEAAHKDHHELLIKIKEELEDNAQS